jgi:phage gp36-like protein
MSYIIGKDLLRTIQDANLQQIISADQTILDAAILAGESEAKSYLRQRFDLTQEFKDTLQWNENKIYYATDRACDANWNIYNVGTPVTLFRYEGLYSVGTQVFWKNKVYTCKIQSQVPDHTTALQYHTIQSIPFNNVAPDDTLNGLQYWGIGVAYAVAAGTPLTETFYWKKEDNRDLQMVMYLCDVALFHLHSRIAPRNIPEIRVKRYDSAISWFHMCAKGEVTPELPLLAPIQGTRIRFGGVIKNINSY